MKWLETMILQRRQMQCVWRPVQKMDSLQPGLDHESDIHFELSLGEKVNNNKYCVIIVGTEQGETITD